MTAQILCVLLMSVVMAGMIPPAHAKDRKQAREELEELGKKVDNQRDINGAIGDCKGWLFKMFMEAGLDPDKRFDDDNFLHYAAQTCCLDIVNMLLSNKAKVDGKDKHGNTPLNRILCSDPAKTLPVARALLEHGADAKTRNKDGRTVLMDRPYNPKSAEAILLLIEKGADVNARDKEGMTPVMHAALTNSQDPKYIRAFMDKGADANALNKEGISLLMHAVRSEKCNPDFLELLIEKGADVNAKDKKGRTPLLFAVSKQRDASSYHDSLGCGKPAVEVLLKHGADIKRNYIQTFDPYTCKKNTCSDKKDTYYSRCCYEMSTILHHVSDAHSDVVSILIKHGVDVKKEDAYSYGLTAFFKAVSDNSQNLTKAFLDAGIDINTTDQDGQTALFHTKYHLDMAQLLLDKGIDISVRMKYPPWNSASPLMTARQVAATKCRKDSYDADCKFSKFLEDYEAGLENRRKAEEERKRREEARKAEDNFFADCRQWGSQQGNSLPEAARSLSIQGDTLAEAQRYDEAAVKYRSVLATAPGYATARFNLASVLGAQKKFAEAVKEMRCYIAMGQSPEDEQSAKDSILKWETLSGIK